MHVLHVIHSIDPRSGGPSNVIRHLVREQVRSGHNVTLLTTDSQSANPWAPASDYRSRMLSEETFRGAKVIMKRGYGRHRPFSRFSYSPKASTWLRGFLSSDLSPDVVHIHGLFSHINHQAALLASRNTIPYAIRPTGALDPECFGLNRARLKELAWRLYLRRDLLQSTAIHVTSQSECETVNERLPNGKTTVIPLGVDLPTDPPDIVSTLFLRKFPQLKNRIIVLFLSRIDRKKRLDLLIEAFERAWQTENRLALVILGNDAGHLKAVNSQIDRLSSAVRESIVFAGFLQGEEKQGALASSRMLAYPSIRENFGLPPIEAMAHGTPTLLTREVGSAAHIEASGCGKIIAPRADCLSDSILETLLQDPDQLKILGQQYVRQHLTWPSISAQIDSMYERMLVNKD